MRISWSITDTDIRNVRELLDRYRGHELIRARERDNVRRAARGGRVPIEEAWWALSACLLTSQQKSGPNSAVWRLLLTKPFVLELDAIAAAADPAAFATRTLRAHKGIRFADKLGPWFRENLRYFAGNPPTILAELAELRGRPGRATERRAARRIAELFVGVGPKQSRNFLQLLGLTRYEVPLDSRFAAWLRSVDFPVPVSTTALSDPSYYEFVLDAVQALCDRAEVLPCMLDAAVFADADSR